MDSTNGPASGDSADPQHHRRGGDLLPEPVVVIDAAHGRRGSPRPRPRPRSRVWVHLSVGAAFLGFAGSIVALADRRIYAILTPAFLPQALAQDLASLVIAPLLAVMAVRAGRGSLRARAIWIGIAAFTFYSEVIYAFAIPFGPLFPVWVAVLGLSLFALILGLRTIGREVAPVGARLAAFSAWFLIVVAGLFAVLWLSEDIPALISGSTPQSVHDLAVPTNPVHILDYAFFLPAAIMTGIGLLRRNRFAASTAPAFCVFLLLTCVPILITPFVSGRGSAGMASVIGLLAVALAVVLVLLLRSIRPEPLSR